MTTPPPPSAYGRASVPSPSLANGPVPPAYILEPGPPKPRSNRVRNRIIALVVFALVIAGGVYIFANPSKGTPDAVSTTDTNSINGVSPTNGSASPSEGTSASPSGPPPGTSGLVPDTVPMPKGDKPGWKQVFSDDFNGTKVSSDKWYTYEGQPQGDPVAWFDPNHVSVKDGMLVISAYKESTPRGNIYATGGVGSNFNSKYGDFQVRYRADSGWGISYAILLWPADNSFPPEVDFAEDNGRGRTMTSATEHYSPNNTMDHHETHGDFTQWHTAEVVWSPGEMQFLIDGRVWTTIQNSHVPTIKMKLAIQMQTFACGRSWEACTNSSTPKRVNLDVDWVSVYTAD